MRGKLKYSVAAIIAPALLVSGCATREALVFDCPAFNEHRIPLVRSSLEEAIHTAPPSVAGSMLSLNQGGAAGLNQPTSIESVMSELIDERAKRKEGPSPVNESNDHDSVLLLSGGGQWGAFGVNFLDELRENGELPKFSVITGVSTGALQALFLVIDDTGAGGWNEATALNELVDRYAIDDEKELVDRNGKLATVFTGSFAGLKPLRREIEKALCPDEVLRLEKDSSETYQNCAIDAIRLSSKTAFIGFVDAIDGKFYYVNVRDLANIEQRSKARECLAGAALASAAMPVFFQQVRIRSDVARDEATPLTTYYDGGVRLSVFEDTAMNAIKTAARVKAKSIAAQKEKLGPNVGTLNNFPLKSADTISNELLPTVYVIRNGPTTLATFKPDQADDERNPGQDALSNALRAETIIVNQMEVGSISALRLRNPTGQIRLATANGYDMELRSDAGEVSPICVKSDPEVMFDPDFMRCLGKRGRNLANSSAPWVELPPLELN